VRRLAIVLHAHVPYVRRNGVWPAGEDLFHQVAFESYLPLLGVFERLADRGLHGVCTVGITPVLAHQMQDAHMRRELESYLGRVELRAMRQVANYKGLHADAVKDLAARYAIDGREAAARLRSPTGGLAGAFGRLEQAGLIEILAGPATHPLLPFVSSPRLRAAQIETGFAEHERIFGRRPEGMWIPECAVAPEVELSLAVRGVGYAVVDPAAVGSVPAFAGETGMLLLPRDRALTAAVWSPGGYPSGEWYRDFQHYDVVGGFKNWRVTARDASLGDKQPYEPEAAAAAARRDAAAFTAAVERRFDQTESTALVVALDAELLGHWWFEGPVWLETLLSLLAQHPAIAPVTLGEVARAAGDAPHRPVSPSSWGAGSDFRNWRSPATESLFRRQADAESRAAAWLDREGAVRDQLLRELMLLQSSDWPYMIARDENAQYAQERFEAHANRFESLAAAAEADTGGGAGGRAAGEAAALLEIDNCFAALPAPHDT